MKSKRTIVLLLVALAGIVMASGCAIQDPAATEPSGTPPGTGDRPNIIVIITDDQRYDSLDYMPQTKSLIFDRGVTFSKAYVTTPLCCPSRASILTGMYAHSHGVINNWITLERPTFVDSLHDNGYYTGFVGKYLNTWAGSPRPEFDYWIGSLHNNYMNPRLNINGEWQVFDGYQTQLLGEYANQFLEEAVQQDKPWLLYYAPHAPHAPALPDPKYQNLYADLPPYRPASFNEADISDKPFRDTNPLLTDDQVAWIDHFRLQQLRTLKSVDDSIAVLFQTLEANGMLDNTAIFFISDNGIMYGEHRLIQVKEVPYEPSSHVPFAFYYAPVTPAPQVIDKLVANIDIAPTIYDLAGIPTPPDNEGLSLLALLHNPNSWRDALLLENWHGAGPIPPIAAFDEETEESVGHPYVAIHTGQYVYIERLGQSPELYDLAADPDQLQNQFDNPDYAAVLAELKAGLDFLKGPYVTTLATQQALATADPSP